MIEKSKYSNSVIGVGKGRIKTRHLGPEGLGSPSPVFRDPDEPEQPRNPEEHQPPMVEDDQQIGSDGAGDGSRDVDAVGHVGLILNQRAPTNEQQACTGDEGEELRGGFRHGQQYGGERKDDGGDDRQPYHGPCSRQIEY